MLQTKLTNRLPVALFLLRLSVFAVFLMWALDKFVNPGHAVAVFENFYGFAGLSTAISYGLGGVQLLIILAFLLGLFKTWSYGLVLLMHGASTLVSWRNYLDPFEGANLLFFAAWPMLAACFALFALRDFDRLWSLEKPAIGDEQPQL